MTRPLLSRRAALAAGAATLASSAAAQAVRDPENTLFLDLKDGRVVIQLRPDLAPQHVARIKELARAKFYDGIVFHRVIPGFMAQSGDPTGTGRGGSGRQPAGRVLPRAVRARHGGHGAVERPQLRRQPVLHLFAPASNLNGQYTVWGQVTRAWSSSIASPRASRRRNPTASCACRSPPTREDLTWPPRTRSISISPTGRVVIRLRADLAPGHVARIKELARAGFYDGLLFHRVIEGFMAQTGDPKGNGTGGSDASSRPSSRSEPFVRGTVGMARAQIPTAATASSSSCSTTATS